MKSKTNFSDVKYNFSKKLVFAMEDIISSDENIYKKVEKIYFIYPTVTSFINAYYVYLRKKSVYGVEKVDEELVTAMRKIISFYKENDEAGIFLDIQNFYKTKNLREVLEYARFIVLNYINGEYNCFDEFLKYYEINKQIFEQCIISVEEFDVDLYKKYLLKKEEICEKEREHKQEIMHNLYVGITTGALLDGTKFDLLEFIKRLPFKKVGTKFCYEITNFLRKNNPTEEATIMIYIKDNKLDKESFNYALNVNYLYQTKCVINGREITNEEIDLIIEYLKQNNIPVVNKTYLLAREKYLNNEIDLEDVMAKKWKKPIERTLIP